MIIFEADHPLVLNGTYDREGYTPAERRAQARKAAQQAACAHRRWIAFDYQQFQCHDCGLWRRDQKGDAMRLFDQDKIGLYLDDIGHRVENTKDGKEIKMVDLTLRCQPFGAELATALDPKVRALLFSLGDAAPKDEIAEVKFRLPIDKQHVTVYRLDEFEHAQIVFTHVEISGIRARTEKGVDGYALVFYASFGPVGKDELEMICDWHTQQRFLTFHPQAPVLNFAGKDAPEDDAPPAPPRRGRRGGAAIQAGDALRPGVAAEH